MKNSCLALVALAFAIPALAHDMWIEPTRFRLQPGATVEFVLRQGEEFTGEEKPVPLRMERVSKLELRSGAHVRDISASGGVFSLEKRGVHILAMERIAASVELEAEKFNTYLEEEGYYDLSVDRIRRGEYGKRVKEKFTRHLKVVLTSGEPLTGDGAMLFGLRLEIVPLDDFSKLRVGKPFRFRILFEGKPLAHARVSLFSKQGGVVAREKMTRTDAKGEGALTIDQTGAALVRVSQLRRCACEDADYESFWGALTFEVE